MQEIVIDIRNVTKTYKLYKSHSDRVKETFHPFRKKYSRPFNALENIDLQVGKGESVGIIGRNGSGKSTLLQLVCSILKPSEGDIFVNGRVSALLELGAGFNPEFTGLQNIYLNSSILGLSREDTEKRLDRVISFADIGEFIHQPVKTYSSGMYIRLAFAIAVHIDPEILIIDEALAVGDIFFRQKCIQHMQEIMKGCTKIIVSHDMQSVAKLCERVVVLDQGKMVFDGSPLKGIEYYTRIMHDEIFKNSCSIETDVKTAPSTEVFHNQDWLDVPQDSIGGACEVVIEKVMITSKEFEPIKIVKAGDYVMIHLAINSFSSKENIIFGYLIKDRVGNAIFGENTVECPKGPVDLTEGRHYVQLGFEWPEIYPSEYTITVGIGEGRHAANHVIQCWAHNILSISAISPSRFVHALFNNPITHLEVNPVGQ
ncbi:MAG: ABC transporter ATP-binding protein [Thermodesulfobacteriota bacterium]